LISDPLDTVDANPLGSSSGKKGKTRSNPTIEIVVTIIIAVAVVLGGQKFFVKPFTIPTESMEPTIDIGQRILAYRLEKRYGGPDVGEIWVFNPPASAESKDGQYCAVPQEPDQPCSEGSSSKTDTAFIKRVVAGPGDTVALNKGRVVLNGKLQKDSFIAPCPDNPSCTFTKPIKIPKDHYYMLGDNRGASLDSRFWGPVPKEWFIGKAFATYWPLKRIGRLK